MAKASQLQHTSSAKSWISLSYIFINSALSICSCDSKPGRLRVVVVVLASGTAITSSKSVAEASYASKEGTVNSPALRKLKLAQQATQGVYENLCH